MKMKAHHDRLRDQGAADFAAGKPIDTFETLPKIRRTELERGSYEVGWRGAKADARAAERGPRAATRMSNCSHGQPAGADCRECRADDLR